MPPAVVAVLVVLALASQLAAAESACRCDGHRGLVCGSDGKTYRSRCHLGCKSAASLAESRPPLWMAHEGACRTGAVGDWKNDFENCSIPCVGQTFKCIGKCRDDACETKCGREHSMDIEGSNVFACIHASNDGISQCRKQCHDDGCVKKCEINGMEKLCRC